MDLTRPQLGSYDCWNCARVPSSYWLSPSVSTAASWAPTSRSDVYFWRHELEVPSPPLKLEESGLHAMSPAVAMTGSGIAGPTGVADAAAEGGLSLPAASAAVTR